MRRPLPHRLLASCLLVIVSATAPSASGAPTPAQAPAMVAPDWHDRPATPGTWSYRQDERGSLALFGIAGRDAALTLRCVRNASVLYLSRAGSMTTPMTVRTTSLTRLIAVQPTGGTPPYVAAALAPTDPLLDAIGFSRGRFVIEQAGAPTLAVPAWAEVERVIEDCRG